MVGDVDLLSLRCQQRCSEATLLSMAGRPRLSSAPYKGCAGGADCPWALLFPSKTREEDGRLPPPSLPPSLRRFWPGCFPLLWVRGRGNSHRRGRRKQTHQRREGGRSAVASAHARRGDPWLVARSLGTSLLLLLRDPRVRSCASMGACCRFWNHLRSCSHVVRVRICRRSNVKNDVGTTYSDLNQHNIHE